MRMRDLAASMMRLSWAMPLFGTARLASVLRGAVSRQAGGLDRLGSSLDAVTWTGHRHLDLVFQGILQAGDDLGSEWIDVFFDALESRSAAAMTSSLAAGLATVARRSKETLLFAVPGESGSVARRELANKLEVYRLVRGVRRRLGLPPAGQSFELVPYVERALALDPYSSLWLIEGLGHDYAAWQLALAGEPAGILTREEAPSPALLMLHAGLGLALAEHVLGGLRPDRPTTAEVARAIERFVDLARRNSRPGFADAALESLGLVARCFYPDLVAPVDRALAGSGGALHGYFWHGVGRAIYFLPVSFLPGYGSIAHAIEMARRQAPDPPSRRHAVAGVAYAVALVNLPYPGVVEHLLRSLGESLRDGAFTEGLVSSIVMRRTTTPDDPGLEIFLRHRPDPADARLAGLWRELISDPVEAASGELTGVGATPASPATGRRGEVYRAITGVGATPASPGTVTGRAAVGRRGGEPR